MTTGEVFAFDSCHRGFLTAIRTTADGEPLIASTLTGSLALTLPEMIAALLTPAVSMIVVVNGPGSYTGVRGGISAAMGLVASRPLKVFAIDRLTSLAHTTEASQVVAVLEAGRGGAYVRAFHRRGTGLAAASEAQHVSLTQWVAPPDYEVVSDSRLTAAHTIGPVDILVAGTKAALQSPAIAAHEIRPVYVSAPAFTTG